MALSGNIFLVITLLTTILILFESINQIIKSVASYKILDLLSKAQVTAIITSFLLLICAFIISDFSVINVYENSHTAKPLFYKISAAWGNHEGSLLLWINLLIFFAFIFFRSARKKNEENKYILWVLLFQNIIVLVFLLFLLISSNPFLELNPQPVEGLGLNPILQDPALAIHPPLLYVGFVGSSIYFSAALSSLVTQQDKRQFALSIKNYVFITWFFQTLGILAGSIWAYYELGWGGFWFWDPVENSSLMPWFAMNALAHSLIVLEKKNIYYHWSIILALMTFLLSVTGTFLVRSGILNSVHSFANDPTRGLFILLILFTLILISIFIFFRYEKENFLNNSHIKSREFFLLINNWLMVFFLAVVLIGTTYPIFLQVISDQLISVGPPYYNFLIVPFAIPMLLLMGLATKLSWNQNNSLLKKNHLAYLVLSFLVLIIINITIQSISFLSSVIFISAFFLIFQNLHEIVIFLKTKKTLMNYHFSHLGFALLILFIGLNHNFSREYNFNLIPGEKVDLDHYEIEFRNIQQTNRENYNVLVGNFLIQNKKTGKEKMFFPEIRLYNNPQTITYEADIATQVDLDLYLTMSNLPRSEFYSIKFQSKPFMLWIWVSVFLIAMGLISKFFLRRYGKID